MKILFLHDKYVKDGGAERYISTKRDIFEKQGNETFLFSLTKEKNLRIKNSKIIKLKRNGILGSYSKMFCVYSKLKNYIKKIKPDIIYIQNNYEYPYSFLKACKGYKTIQRVHDYGIICPSRWCVYKDNLKVCDGKMGIKCLRHKCVSLPTFLSYYLKLKYIKNNPIIKEYISPSNTLKNYMIKNGFRNVKFVKYPLDIKERKEKIKRRKNLFVYIGGLYEHKGIYLLLNAFNEVAKRIPSVKLEIIGTGPELNNIKKLVAKYGLNSNVSFLGKVDNRELYKYYKQVSAVIVPSIWMENYPHVVMESLHFNTPVIGSNIGGIKEQITNKKKGVLFERNNKNDLVIKMLEKLKDQK